MPVARYWRIVGVETYAGGDLELSELHLYGTSGRLDATATLTSTIAPTAGTLAALQDDNLGTACRFAAAAVRASGFALVWDFGAGNTADTIGVRLGATTAPDTFLAGGMLQYSTDGVQWGFFEAYNRFQYPGAGAYTVVLTAGDPDFDKVALLLHMDGADGSTVITDSSQRPKTVTAMGDAKISTAQGLFGGDSGYFDGSGDYLIFPHGPDFDFGTGAFTIEFFLYRTGGTTCVLVSSRESLPQGTKGQLEIGINANNTLYFHDGVNTFTSSLSIQNNVWSHGAFCSPGNGQVSIFIGGALAFSGTCETHWTYTSNWMVGRWAGGTQYNYQGYLRELRITKGVARYTANFTPPTAPFRAVGAGGMVFVAPTMHTAASAAQIAASTPVPAFSTRRAHRLQMARDVEVGGPGTIYGTTKTKGTPNQPTHARVVLLHQRSKLPVRETWSDPVTGAFAFTGIDTTQQFITLAEDAAGNFRPVAANRLTPEVP